MKFTTKHQAEITNEIEVELPMFVKHAASYFKIISENESIEIDTYHKGSMFENYYGIKFGGNDIINSSAVLNGEKITEQEFDNHYNNALNVIQQKFDSIIVHP